MEKDNITVPVHLLYLGPKEYIAACLAAGVLSSLAYQAGKSAQRRWITRMVKLAAKKD
jgi:hypothetical protein